MNTNIVFQNSLIMVGLLIPAASVVLIAVRVLAGRGIVLKVGFVAMTAIVFGIELGFILGQLGLTPLNTAILYGIGIGGTIVLLYAMFRLVVMPIQTLIAVGERIAQGDLRETVTHESKDEIGQLADMLRATIAYQREMAGVAEKMAVGDLSSSLPPKSADDILGNAFRQMVTYQQQMAEAARRLAQGDVTANVIPQSDQDVLGNAFTQMIAYQQQMAETAGRLARGDITADVAPQSEKDALASAFNRMADKLRETMGEMDKALGDAQQKVDYLNNVPTPVVVIDRDYNVQFINESGAQIAGITVESAVGQKCYHLFKTGHCQTSECRVWQAMTQNGVFTGQTMSQAMSDLPIQYTAAPLKDSAGNIVGALEYIADISDIKRVEQDLRNLIGQLQQSADQVASASQQLNATAEQASQAAQQVANTIQQVTEGTNQQTQSVTEATSNVEQIARVAEGIAQGSQEQAQGVQKTSGLIDEMVNIVDQVGQVADSVTGANTKVTQAARHGVSSVEQTGQGMNTIRNRTAVAVDKVKEMGARSKEIGRIVETIDDIADKTDMLALNAAVEAARAGEHGRGFAVVADQVRKLSEDSKNATQDIGQLIERVQETINEAIAAMESTATEVDNGTRLAGDTTQSLQDILQAAEEAADLAGQINQAVAQLKQKSEGVVSAIESVSTVVEENTAAAEEMAANSQEVTTAMEGVASIAEENSASAEEVSASAEEMSAQTEEVVASAEELAALAEQLREATAQFRVEQAGWVEQRRPEYSPEMAPIPVRQ